MYNLLVIHGAWATPRSFRFIKQNVNYDKIRKVIEFSYDCNVERIDKIVRRVEKILYEEEQETIVVGHSLGGLIALATHDIPQCAKIITLSTPTSGIGIPYLLEIIRVPIIMSVAPHSKFIKALHKALYTKDIVSFISMTGFNPLIFDQSDGVVSVHSQGDWMPASARPIPLDCNHFEILQHEDVVSAIDRFSLNELARI